MLANTSLRLSKTAVQCIRSSIPARVLQQTSFSSKTSTPQVSQGEKAWCDIYGVDYEKQIQEALQESPAATAKQINHPTAASTTPCVNAHSKTDVWNVVFGEKESE